MLTLSLLRITIAPGTGSELRILDWGELSEVPLPPWAQTNQIEPGVLASEAMVVARGNLARQLVVTRRRTYATSAAMLTAALDLDAALAPMLHLTAALSIRLLDQAAATTGTETERTLKHYTATQSAIKSMVPRPVPEELALDTVWTLDLGKIVVGTP